MYQPPRGRQDVFSVSFSRAAQLVCLALVNFAIGFSAFRLVPAETIVSGPKLGTLDVFTTRKIRAEEICGIFLPVEAESIS
jgi:hypothetical protein